MRGIQSKRLEKLCTRSPCSIHSSLVGGMLDSGTTTPSGDRAEPGKLIRRLQSVNLLSIGRYAIRINRVKRKIRRALNTIIHSLIRACEAGRVTLSAILNSSVEKVDVTVACRGAYRLHLSEQ